MRYPTREYQRDSPSDLLLRRPQGIKPKKKIVKIRDSGLTRKVISADIRAALPKPETAMPESYWSRQRGVTVIRHASVRQYKKGRKIYPAPSLTEHGMLNSGFVRGIENFRPKERMSILQLLLLHVSWRVLSGIWAE